MTTPTIARFEIVELGGKYHLLIDGVYQSQLTNSVALALNLPLPDGSVEVSLKLTNGQIVEPAQQILTAPPMPEVHTNGTNGKVASNGAAEPESEPEGPTAMATAFTAAVNRTNGQQVVQPQIQKARKPLPVQENPVPANPAEPPFVDTVTPFCGRVVKNEGPLLFAVADGQERGPLIPSEVARELNLFPGQRIRFYRDLNPRWAENGKPAIVRRIEFDRVSSGYDLSALPEQRGVIASWTVVPNGACHGKVAVGIDALPTDEADLSNIQLVDVVHEELRGNPWLDWTGMPVTLKLIEHEGKASACSVRRRDVVVVDVWPGQPSKKNGHGFQLAHDRGVMNPLEVRVGYQLPKGVEALNGRLYPDVREIETPYVVYKTAAIAQWFEGETPRINPRGHPLVCEAMQEAVAAFVEDIVVLSEKPADQLTDEERELLTAANFRPANASKEDLTTKSATGIVMFDDAKALLESYGFNLEDDGRVFFGNAQAGKINLDLADLLPEVLEILKDLDGSITSEQLEAKLAELNAVVA